MVVDDIHWHKEMDHRIMESFRALRRKIGLLTTFFGVLGLSVPGADAAEARPVLVITSPRYDAGAHHEGETVSHTFEVKNNGSAELQILQVKPG